MRMSRYDPVNAVAGSRIAAELFHTPPGAVMLVASQCGGRSSCRGFVALQFQEQLLVARSVRRPLGQLVDRLGGPAQPGADSAEPGPATGWSKRGQVRGVLNGSALPG